MNFAHIFKYKKPNFENLDDFYFTFRAYFEKPAHMLLETTFVLETHLHFFGGQFGPSKMAEWENPVNFPCTLSNTCMHGEVVYKQGRSGKVKCAQFCFSRGDPLRHRQPLRFQADVMDDLLQRARGTWVELIKQPLHDHVQDPAQAVDVIAHSISGSQA